MSGAPASSEWNDTSRDGAAEQQRRARCKSRAWKKEAGVRLVGHAARQARVVVSAMRPRTIDPAYPSHQVDDAIAQRAAASSVDQPTLRDSVSRTQRDTTRL